MTRAARQTATHLTVLVPDETTEVIRKPTTPVRPGEFREEGLVEEVRKRLFKDKKIPFDKIENELTRVELEIDALLAKLKAKTTAGYELSQVQVMVGVSAQGSIALVTAGVQASLTLVYTRRP